MSGDESMYAIISGLEEFVDFPGSLSPVGGISISSNSTDS